MAVVPLSEKKIKQPAHLVRAEAKGDGKQKILTSGKTGVIRVRADCLNYKGIRSHG
ncbi:hypothetical protein [Halobacillus sp. Marseille-P3879]|uniref:hypothetical protein n=1 Tax=Halobacillus sp. Marseille-P3879 TaxID=2045014 RepID=UPI0013596A49|nr:hypothetical protein [Halobacillus sp. Marseille-P3879]